MLLSVRVQQVGASVNLACGHGHSVGASLLLGLLNGLAVIRAHDFSTLGDGSSLGNLLLSCVFTLATQEVRERSVQLLSAIVLGICRLFLRDLTGLLIIQGKRWGHRLYRHHLD